jgi:hypothetical protein
MVEKITCYLKVTREIVNKSNHFNELEDKFVGSPEEAICYLVNKYGAVNKMFLLPAYMTVGFIELAKKIEEKAKK